MRWLVVLFVGCSPLTPLRADAGDDAGVAGGGFVVGGGAALGGGRVGGGGVPLGGGSVVGGGAAGGAVTLRDAGWPAMQAPDTLLEFREVPAPSLRETALTSWANQLFALDATGPLWRFDGQQWTAVNPNIGGAALHLTGALPQGPMTFSGATQWWCTSACLDGGAPERSMTSFAATLVCRGALPLRLQTNLGSVGEFRDGGWVGVGGQLVDISSPTSGCYTTASGRTFFGGPRVRELPRDGGGLQPVSPAFPSADWSDFAEPAFGLVAVGPAQQLALVDGGAWELVTDRNGLMSDAWIRGVALGDGRLGLVGTRAFSLVEPGVILSVPWPQGRLTTSGSGVTVDDAGTVWVAGAWTDPNGTTRKVVGVRPR